MPKIYIDAGHGGPDSGATYQGRLEKNDNLWIALKVRELLIARNIDVLMARMQDSDIKLIDRVNAANAAKVDYYLSLHRNAGGGTGPEAWVYSKANAETQRRAKLILDAVAGVTGLRNRGVKFGAPKGRGFNDYWVNSGTTMTASLLEISFVDTPGDNANFDANIDAIAAAVSRALCEVVGVSWEIAPAPVKTSPAPAQPAKKSNAEIAEEVIAGKWGNGDDRKRNLAAAGYDYAAVQAIVNRKVKAPEKKTNDQIAKEVIQGKWGKGTDRKKRLTDAGYNYSAIQKIVNKLV